MKQVLIRLGAVAFCFIMTVIITSKLVNLDYQDMTTDISTATLPVVSIEYNGIEINRMYGYLEDMKISYMRDSITPLMSGRRMHIKVDTYDARVRSMNFEVRTVDDSRLVENTDITDSIDLGRDIEADIVLKDLYDINSEYEFILYITLSDGRVARYYTRVVNPSEYFVSDKLEYVSDFSNRIFNKEEAISLKTYLESKSSADNTNFGFVNINNSLDQVTWGELEVKQVTEPIITIKELASRTGSFIVDYYVSMDEEGVTKYFHVVEFYRVRYGSERMYLLDYERTMDEIFTDARDNFSENSIHLGITGSDIKMTESEDGNNIVFVSGKRLFEYTVNDNKIASVFGYYDMFTQDERQMNDDFDIKVMTVDEQGNITFLVYGYMNRGDHEGESGMSAYYYNAQVNTIEELAYVPSALSPDLLMKRVEELSYMNSKGELYFLVGDSLYRLNAENVSVDVVTDSLMEGGYVVSDDNKQFAYITGESTRNSQEIKLLNLETGSTKTLNVGNMDTIALIDYIQDDLIYGIVHKEDISLDRMGNTILPMYQLIIYNEIDGELMTYARDNIYVVSGEVNGDQILLQRVERVGDSFVETLDDQIVNSEVNEVAKNLIKYSSSDKYKKEAEISVKKTIEVPSMKHLNPKMVLYEGDRVINVDEALSRKQFVVYGKYGAESIHADEAKAVLEGYNIAGVVMNEAGAYVYKKTTLNVKNQIMAIQPDSMTETRSSLAVCMDVLLGYEGVIRNSQYMLNQGDSVLDILNTALEDCQVLDLTGCTLDIVLYYVNQDIPVLVMLDDSSAVLLIGYNEEEVVLMDPKVGEIYKISREEATQMFERTGNGFITYLRKVEE